MACNTGVSLTPLVNGEVHHFENRGLYDGLSTLWDEETGSIWNHITGEAVYGPLKGYRLPVYNLLHMNAESALATYPDLQVAVSERPMREVKGRNYVQRLFDRFLMLTDRLQGTILEEDERRPTMEVGIGIWTEESAKYFPMEVILEAGDAMVDELNDRPIVLYVEPSSRAPSAFYAETRSATWVDDELRLDDGVALRDGRLFDADGERLEVERPLQLFTRWYGFALTFPETDVYGE